MKRLRKDGMRLALVLTLLVVATCGVTTPAQAQGVVGGEKIPAGEVVEGTVVLSGDNIVIDGTVQGDVLALGGTVTVNGTVEGSLVTAAQKVSLNGEVGGSLYVLAGSLELDPSAVVGNSGYVAGGSLFLDSGSQIERDLRVIGLGARFNGEIGRDLKAIIGPFEILTIVANSFGWELRLGGEQPPSLEEPEGTPSAEPTPTEPSAYHSPGGVILVSWTDDAAQLQTQLQTPTTPGAQPPRARTSVESVGEWLLERLRWFVILTLLGLLALWLIPVPTARLADEVRAQPLVAAGYGLAGLATGFLGAVLLTALVYAIVTGLQFVTLGRLALIVAGIGFLGLAFAFVIFSFLVFFGSKIIVSYLVGTLILERSTPDVVESNILPLLLGLAIYVLVSAIPFFGWAVAFVVTLLGLGSIWLLYQEERRAEIAEGTALEPA